MVWQGYFTTGKVSDEKYIPAKIKSMHRYIIIEYFKKGKIKEIYRRFDEQGRMMPNGLEYLDSWIDEDVTVCYQLMQSPSRDLLDEWIANWSDLVDFTVVPVISSAEAKAKVFNLP